MTASLDELICETLRHRREAAGVTQAELARAARRGGLLDWQQPTVAALETGHRRLSIDELMLLPRVLHQAGITTGVVGGVVDLIPDSTTPVLLAGRVVTTAASVRQLAHGDETVLLRIAIDVLTLESSEEALQQAARKLRVAPRVLAHAARRRWGHSFTRERDRRLEGHPRMPSRTRQARRGHVTRALLAELAPLIAGRPARPRLRAV
jgi:transcriptional regulator with XRE-family HTH domain